MTHLLCCGWCPRKGMVDGNGDVYQSEGSERVNEFISAIYKERQVWHLKKIWKTFVKDLKYTHLINIWNVMWAGDKYFNIPRSNQEHLTSDIWHLTYNIKHTTYNIWHMAFDIWHSTSDIWHPTSDIWHLKFVICHLTFDIVVPNT